MTPSRRSLSAEPWSIRLDPQERGEYYPEELNRSHRGDARWTVSTGGPDWLPIGVARTWQGQGYDYNGVAWYRTVLPDPGTAGSPIRTFIEFESVDYFADVWLNGRCLGSHEGPFTAFGYELTPYLRPDGNLLCVRVDSPVTSPGYLEETDQLKTLFKGVLERTDTNNPNLVPGGITGEVTLIQTGPARLGALQVSASPVNTADELGPRADSVVTVTATLDGPDHLPARVRLRILAPGSEHVLYDTTSDVLLTAAPHPVTLQTRLPDAELWWPWDLGTPAMHIAEVSVEIDGYISDTASRPFGIRTVCRREGWATYLNGVRIFQRGANYVCDQLRENATAERYETDIALLTGANLNTVHPFCTIERQQFYDTCDRAGVLVYQDFPAWMTVDDSSETVRRALTVQQEMISQFAHHPSIIVWNCGSQASVANAEKLCSALADQARRSDPTRVTNLTNAALGTEPDHRNRTHPRRSFFWDLSHARRLADQLDWRWDTHHYDGWYIGEVDDIEQQPLQYLDLVTEFGAQGIPGEPALQAMMPVGSVWPPDWEQWATHCAQPELIKRRLPREIPDLATLVAASQTYQAHVVKRHAEYYRRLRFRPCNGAHVFMFVDYWPAITWSLLDYDRQPKAAYRALRMAMQPTQILLDLARRSFSQSDLVLPAVIVNDRRVRYRDARLDVLLDGQEVASIEPLDILAGGLVEAPAIHLENILPGAHDLTLLLSSESGALISENHYSLDTDQLRR